MEHYYFDNGLIRVRDRVKELLEGNGRVVVAFDGRSAAGKTTAAEWLARWFDGEVIHMDDFFLPAELRTEKRLAQPGGNVHYERFADEVLGGLKSGRPFDYRVFDCSSMTLGSTGTAGSSRLLVIEGAYSLHPRFERYYDLAVFFDIDPEQQKKCILERNGAEKLKAFTERWIPFEERYIAAYDVIGRCDFTVKREHK